MLTLETYRRQAKLLVRSHRERNHSLGGRIRLLPRYSQMSDAEALAHPFTLAEAQEIIAQESGYKSWAALKNASAANKAGEPQAIRPLRISTAVPVLYVADVASSAAFYRDKLGFTVDFLHGEPPFYGSVSRDAAKLHLKWVREPVFGDGHIKTEGLIMAFCTGGECQGALLRAQSC